MRKMFSMPLPSLPWGHNRWSRQASAFVDNELAVASRADFERHLAGCPRCQQEAGLAVIALITVVTIDLTSSHSTGNTTSAHELRESAASAPNTAQDSTGKSAAATPAGSSALAIPPSTPPPGIVPPTGGGVGGQGVPCGASIQPLTPSSGAAAPLTPCPSPSPVASREGSASTLSPSFSGCRSRGA